MTDLAYIGELTSTQASIVRYYIRNYESDLPEDVPEPKLKNQRLGFPDDPEAYKELRDSNQLYKDYVMDAGEVDTVQGMVGKERASENLMEKIRGSLSPETIRKLA